MGMADGYAQASGTVGHVNLHTAPGVGNGMGAIFNAQANHTPLLVTRRPAGARADHPPGQPDQPRRGPNAPPAGEVELRAAPRGRRPARPGARDPPCEHAGEGPCFVSVPMDDWDAEVSGAEADAAIDRSVSASSGPDPDAMTALARKLDEAANPVFVAGPDIDAAGAWEAAVALVERLNLPVFAIPAPGGGRLGFPEGHPNFRGILPPAIGPLAETLRGDLILVAGLLGVPDYPEHPGAPARGRDARADHERPGRGPPARRMERDPRRREACAPHLLGARGCWPPRRAIAAESVPGDEADPITGTAAMNALREAFPDGGIVVLEAPRPRSPYSVQRISRPGSYDLGAGGGLGFGLAAAVGVQLSPTGRSSASWGRGRRSTRSRRSGARPRTRCRSRSSYCATPSTRSSNGSRTSRESVAPPVWTSPR